MTTLKKLEARAAALESESDALYQQARDKQDEADQVRAEIGAHRALKLYGLKAGDVIEITETRGLHNQTRTYRMRILSFSATGPDDTSPDIRGYVLNKAGNVVTRGRRSVPRLKTLYYFDPKKVRKVNPE